MDDKQRLLNKILEGRHLTPVFQPIVSLVDGKTYGYEALSRISQKELEMNIEEMFLTAFKHNKSWELETLCRVKALEHSIHMERGKKLFLNVNCNIIYDIAFREGFTKAYLKKFGLNSNDIIFEITESVSILDTHAFTSAVEHYQKQNYGIAIDDVGAGYSGLNIIANARPDLIKLDMNMIRNVHKYKTKQLLIKALSEFGKNAGILVIAEGIETEAELETLVSLGVGYGQGFFLGCPDPDFKDISKDKTDLIRSCQAKNYIRKNIASLYPMAGYLSRSGHTFFPHEKALRIYEELQNDSSITEFTVTEGGAAIGFMTRTSLIEKFGGRYGFSLNSKRSIQQLTSKNFLSVNYDMPVNQVSKLAMQRHYDQLYNPIVVEKEGMYWGIVTIKDLLEACTKVEVDTAMHSNPLTGLPGNLLIDQEILYRVLNDSPYCIIYFDIDNFKSYNDAYSFQSGDMMLMLLADILKKAASRNEFIGHIGGDDFIVICDYHEAENYCEEVIERFSHRVSFLYHKDDMDRGYIISKNRRGITEEFPIASLSVAGISNRIKTYKDMDAFSADIAELKKKCKRQNGSYYEIE